MRRDAIDLRNVRDQPPTVPLTFRSSVMIAAFLIIAGIALTFIGLSHEGGHPEAMDGNDRRPYIFLSSTIDRASDRMNNTYEDLEVSRWLHLMLTDILVSDLNITSELEHRLTFMYEDADSILLSAAAEGMAERTICGGPGAGNPIHLTVQVPLVDGSMTITISLWGYEG